VFWIAPLGVVILLVTFYLFRAGETDMRVQDTAFDRDWNEQMSVINKRHNPKLAGHNERRAVEAQSRYSSALQEQADSRNQMQQQENDINQAVKDINSKLNGGQR